MRATVPPARATGQALAQKTGFPRPPARRGPDSAVFPRTLVVNANETLFYPADDRSAGLLIHTSCGTLPAFGGPFTNRSGCSA